MCNLPRSAQPNKLHPKVSLSLFYSHRTWALCSLLVDYEFLCVKHPRVKIEAISLTDNVFPKLGHATRQCSQVQEQISNRMTEKPNEGVAMAQSKPRCCSGTSRELQMKQLPAKLNELKQCCKEGWAKQ